MQDDYQKMSSFFSTPSFWKGELLGLQPFYLDELDLHFTEDEKEHFKLPAIPEGTVLGKRAEYYFKYCVEKSRNYKILASNIQIFKGKVTIGELDYILQNTTTGKKFHVELVYKFYLHDPLLTYQGTLKNDPEMLHELARYTGPNRRDHFLQKLERLKNRQLPLLYRSETAPVLKNYHIDVHQLEQRVCFLAQIFIPRDLWNHNFRYLNKRCITGYYVTYSAFAKAETQNTYFLPYKYQWKMQPMEQDDIQFSHQALCQVVKENLSRRFAPLIWMRCQDHWERFFIIAD